MENARVVKVAPTTLAVKPTETKMKIAGSTAVEAKVPLWARVREILSPEFRKKVCGDIILGKLKKPISFEERKEVVVHLLVDSKMEDVKFVVNLCSECNDSQMRNALINNLVAYKREQISGEDLAKIVVLSENTEDRMRIVEEMFKRGMEKEAWDVFKSIFNQVVAQGQLQWIPYLKVKNEDVKSEIFQYLTSLRDEIKTSEAVKVYAATILYADFNDTAKENRKYIIAGACDKFGEEYGFNPEQFIMERMSKAKEKDLNPQKLMMIKESVVKVKEAMKKEDVKAEKLALNSLGTILDPMDLDMLFQQEKIFRKAAALRNSGMKITFQGSIPYDTPKPGWAAMSKYLSVRDLKGASNIVVTQKESKLIFLQFNKNKCEKLRSEIDGITKETCWTVGDYDNDGKEEILVCAGNKIKIYKWKRLFGKIKINSTIYQSKYPIKDIVCGDINNDKQNEMTIFTTVPPVNSIINKNADRVLVILKYHNGAINPLWMDMGKYRFSNGEMVPPDRLGIVTDLDNSGLKKLIIYNQRSDVGPQIYTTFVWNKDRLNLEDIFRIEGYQMKIGRETSNLIAPWISSELYPVRVRATNYFYAGDWAHQTVGTSSINLFKYDGRQLETVGCTIRTYNMSLLVCDPDGKGPGLLKIFSGENRYEFYRTEVNRQISKNIENKQ